MTARVLLVSLAVLGLCAVPAGATIVPGKGMAGVELDDCRDAVAAELGKPDSTVTRTDFAGRYKVSSYRARGLKITFRPGESCARAVAIFTSKGEERTAEGVGKGTRRSTLRARLRGERCRPYRVPRRVRSCTIGSFRPGTVVTDFRIDSKARVSSVSVALVID
jgi:hypothetical protein